MTPFSADPPTRDPAAIAADLLGRPVTGVASVYGGRNSRVFRITCGGDSYALKLYASHGDDRDRLGGETGALAFLARHGVSMVPRVIAADPGRGAAVFTWADGGPALPAGAADVDAALDFLRIVHGLRGADGARALGSATEACLSPAELLEQLERRHRRLRTAAGNRIGSLLEDGIRPLLDEAAERARRLLECAGTVPDADLPWEARTLSPSDFGFHNARRNHCGALTFLDFEYFGWDDPVKLVADVLLHPGMELEPELRARFRAGADRIYGNDDAFAVRLSVLLPLYALRWCLIILNEFLPERWQQRLHAGVSESRDAVLAVQEAKARRFLERAADLAGQAAGN